MSDGPQAFLTLARVHAGVFTVADAGLAGVSRDSLRWAITRGIVLRLRHGAFTSRRLWESCSTSQQHALLVLAHQRRSVGQIGWGLSAAQIWGLPLPDPVTAPSLRRRSPGEPAVCVAGGPLITTATRSVLDAARLLSPGWGLAVADAALAATLITRAGLVAAAPQLRGWPGATHAEWVAQHARPGVESPLESLARGAIVRAGFSEPTIQYWISTSIGRFRVDLVDLEHRVITEADGKVKYLTPADLRREKRREDALRDSQFEVVRFTIIDHFHPDPWIEAYRRALARSAAR